MPMYPNSPECPQPFGKSGMTLPGDGEFLHGNLGFGLLAPTEVRRRFTRYFTHAGDIALHKTVDLSCPYQGHLSLGQLSGKPALQNSRPCERGQDRLLIRIT